MGLLIQGSYSEGGQIFRTVRTTQPPTQWVKRKGKVRPISRHEGPRKRRRYSSTHFLTSAVDRSKWLTPLYLRGRDLVHIEQEVWRALRPFWTCRENAVHIGIRTPVGAARSESLYRPPIYITGTGSFSGKRRGRGVDHAHQLAQEYSYTSTPSLYLQGIL
jgi:hypothetical protein